MTLELFYSLSSYSVTSKFIMASLLKCRFLLVLVFVFVVFKSSYSTTSVNKGEEQKAMAYLQDLDHRYSLECNKYVVAHWNYNVNVTLENEQILISAAKTFIQFQSTVQAEINKKYNNWNSFPDKKVRREFQYLSVNGPATMSLAKVDEMNQLLSRMKSAYATATACDFDKGDNCQLQFDSDTEEKLSNVVKPSDYTKFFQLQNEMARANSFNDTSEMWLASYDDGTTEWTPTKFKNEIIQIWGQLKPIYSKLHAYIRMKLRKDPLYKGQLKKYGYLPAHLIGSSWSQELTILNTKTKPFPNIPILDATAAMMKQNYTIQKIYREANKFFQGIGLPAMTQTFWDKSVLEKSKERPVVCQNFAEDFCLGPNSTDFRIKMCTTVNMDSIIKVHQQMGRIAYFMQYTNEHYIFRNGANPSFQEAIANVLGLTVKTPKHMQCVLGLELGISCADSKAPNNVTKLDINFLYSEALQKIGPLSLAIATEKWHWEVFEGKLEEKNYNKRWWELKLENQGVSPSTIRPETNFDPGTSYHVVANIPSIRHFISQILQFQFYEALCKAADEYNPDDPNTKPLYQCDFTGNLNAGKMLSDLMKMGFTKPWPEALETVTKSRKISLIPLLNYFQPMLKLFDDELAAARESDCFGADCQSVAAEYLKGPYQQTTTEYCNKVAKANWDYNLDLNNETAEETSNLANIEYSKYLMKEWSETISQFDYQAFDDSDLTKRQLLFLNAVGIPALDESDLEKYNQVLSTMSKIYGNGKICPFHNQYCDIETDGLSLEPDLEEIMAQSQDYDELAYVWTEWRNVSGKKIRGYYEQYVEISNKAAKLNGYDNMGDFWLLSYESETFKTEMETLWQTVRPLYEELHAYVRFKLGQIYPQIDASGLLPAHVLGNMWAQTWDNIFDKIVPFEQFPSFDMTQVLKEKFTPDLHGISRMFWTANDFFVSTGLANMSVAYGDKAMIIKPENKSVMCHASAWDMCNGVDYRIKMCTNVDMEDFLTIHHEFGHIQYYMNYHELPITLKEGANEGFQEAIGDVISLSVSSPQHMVKIGLLTDAISSNESTINFLMKMSLDKVSFLPFAYLIDAYRWRIFEGSITPQTYTYNWLKMRAEYQGIVPPVKRNEDDFDAGAKYHVPGDTTYIRYFFSYILQFHLHKILCDAAGELKRGRLHECDIYKNVDAGLKLKRILESGASKNWKVLLNETTGSPDLDATALLEYFQPLRDYLEAQRTFHNYPIGWDSSVFEHFYEKAK